MNECHFYMEPWNHDLESLLLQPKLCSTSNGTMWNHVEPSHCTRSPQGPFNSASKSMGLLCFHIGLCWMCITSDKRHHAVVLKCVAVSPERPCWDEKFSTHYTNEEVTMGLDVYAGYLHPKPEQPDNVVDIKDNIGDRMEAPYYWRKHARLQQFMTELWHEKNGTKMQGIMGPDGFNGGDVLILNKDDILSLQTQVENDSLPFCPDGFFWGQQFQEEAMKDFKQQDLKFCKDALQWLEEGKEVWYESSW